MVRVLAAAGTGLGLLADLALLGHAISVQFTRVSPSPSSSSTLINIGDATKDQDSDDAFDYINSNNVSGSDIYVASLGVAGQSFEVQLDTGSSDLWIDTSGVNLGSLTSTGLETGLTYG